MKFPVSDGSCESAVLAIEPQQHAHVRTAIILPYFLFSVNTHSLQLCDIRPFCIILFVFLQETIRFDFCAPVTFFQLDRNFVEFLDKLFPSCLVIFLRFSRFSWLFFPFLCVPSFLFYLHKFFTGASLQIVIHILHTVFHIYFFFIYQCFP